MIGADLSSLEFNKYMNLASDYLTKLYIKLGRPEADYGSNNFWVMIDELVNMWSVVYKEEAENFIHDIRLERAIESGVGRDKMVLYKKSIAYPPHFYQMVKVFFNDLKLQDKKFIEKFLNRYPAFNASNSR